MSTTSQLTGLIPLVVVGGVVKKMASGVRSKTRTKNRKAQNRTTGWSGGKRGPF